MHIVTIAVVIYLRAQQIRSAKHHDSVMRKNAFPPAIININHVSFAIAMAIFLLFAMNILSDAVATVILPRYHSSSLMTGVVTSTAACYVLISAILEPMNGIASTPRMKHIFVPLIVASSFGVVSPLGELHDLDDDGGHGPEGMVGYGYDRGEALIHSVSEESDIPINQPHNMLGDDKYPKKDNPNIVDRFSNVIAKEIMRRLKLMQTSFQFEVPWRWRKYGRQKRGKGKEMKRDLFKREGSSDVDIPHYKGSTSVVDVQSKRRVGAWCPANSLTASDTNDVAEAHMVDKSVVPCPLDSSQSLESADSCNAADDSDGDSMNDLQAGMVVYVFPQGEFDPGPESAESSLERIEDMRVDAKSNDDSIHGKRCLLEMGQQFDDDEQIVQYTLLEREPVELGLVDVHRKDFAYRPVALTIGGVSHSHALQARIKPEEEAMETLAKSSSHPHLPWNDDDVEDQQVSFRWFSWFSQFQHRDNYPDGDKGLSNHDVIVSESPEHHSYAYHGQQSSYHGNALYEEDGKRPFAGGSHGEIWRARRRCPLHPRREEDTRGHSNHSKSSCDDGKDLIVKRLKIEYGYSVLEAGLREVYFGELLAREAESSNLFTTYVDHFFREGANSQIELWIVFENAGPSLRSFLYTPITAGGFVVFQNSAFWRRLRRSIAGGKQCKGCDEDNISLSSDHTHKGRHEDNGLDSERNVPEGRTLLREVLKQLITAVAFLHERGIVHRDIKPSNVMCETTPPSSIDGVMPPEIDSVHCLLGDFSSAWDEFSDRNLYAPNGPSSKEQTDEYAPPEVLFQGRSWSPFFNENPFSYDSWSIGVVALEILIGTPNVFSVDQRTTALLTNRLKKEGATHYEIQRALYLAALSQFCIYVPTESEGKNWPLRRGDPLHDVNVVKHTCTLKDFHRALRARDPLGIGFQDDSNTLLHLIWRLLDWNPLLRLSASAALEHPYFESANKRRDWNPTFLHTKLFVDVDTIVGNALEHQTLDPRVDISSDTAIISEFTCPKCGKSFDDWNSCQRHARSRRHAKFCTYDRSLLPQCLNAHSMLPTHPTSGYCDIQGRRKTIEDFHTVHLNPRHQFYGVFDGHLGNLASKYAASSFYHEVEECLSDVDSSIEASKSNWKKYTTSKLVQSFQELHNGIIDAITSSPGGVMDESGTTATILYVTELAVIIANVGDSRAIMSEWLVDAKGNEHMTAMQLTVDHVASSEKEQIQILERGGFVSKSGGIDRVNGSLAVSRSLGDIKLAPFLSRTPDVFALTKEEAYEKCGKIQSVVEPVLPCFIILASDGLWDVVSNQEAVDLAWQVIKGNHRGTAFQEAAEVLTQEAYVRGSSDNIGVCVVAIM